MLCPRSFKLPSLLILLAFTPPISISAVSATPLALKRQAAKTSTGLISILSQDGGQTYFVNATVDGVSNVKMQVDTGGSDTWIIGSTQEATSENPMLNLRPREAVVGRAVTSDFMFDSAVITTQTMLQVKQNDSQSVNPGVLGLGRSGRSVIFNSFDQSVKTDLAESIVDSYARLNSETPFMTLLMPRGNDAGSMGFGAIKDSFTPSTLGGSNGEKAETIDLSKIRDAPRLLSQKALWRVEMDDAFGWAVNGRDIVLPRSIFASSGATNLTFAFDTGFPTTIVRAEIADAIYALLPTARFDLTANAWHLPCKEEVKMSIRIGGVEIPIHPLDIVSSVPFGDGTCLGSFQPRDDAVSVTGDIVAGTNFMHNVYALFSTTGLSSGPGSTFTSTKDPKDPKIDRPFIQLLPLTRPDVAHREFLAAQSANSGAAAAQVANSQSTVDFDAERKRLGLDSGAVRSVPSWALMLGMALGLHMIL